jgi:Flp pilus assembly protein protease CpaA
MNNITLSGTLQILGFCIVTLLATGVLVLAGLNERSYASGNLISGPHTTKDSR